MLRERERERWRKKKNRKVVDILRTQCAWLTVRGGGGSPVDLVLTVAVDAGVAEALVDLGEAGGVLVTVGTRAGEAVDAIDAGAAVVAGVDGALVDVDVTHGAWK